MGARLDRGAARPRRPRLFLVDPRSRSVAAGGCSAALAGRGHEPGLVLSHAAEVPRAPGAASDGPTRAARRPERLRDLLRPEAHRELGGAHPVAPALGVGGPRADLVRGLPRSADEERTQPPGDRARRRIDRRARGDRLRLRALPHAGQARPGLADGPVERGDLRHDAEPRRVRQRQGRVHAVDRGHRRERGRAAGSPVPGHGRRGGTRHRLPLVVGRGHGRFEARRKDAVLRQRRVVRGGRPVPGDRDSGRSDGGGPPHPGARQRLERRARIRARRERARVGLRRLPHGLHGVRRRRPT